MTDWIDDAEAACEAEAEAYKALKDFNDKCEKGASAEAISRANRRVLEAQAVRRELSFTALPRALAALRAADELAEIAKSWGSNYDQIKKAAAAYRKARHET